jgi:hypothetical protein
VGAEGRDGLGGGTQQRPCGCREPSDREQASVDRVAIGRSLIEHGFLLVRRKRISLPIRRQRVNKIS